MTLGGRRRFAAAEDAARLRDGARSGDSARTCPRRFSRRSKIRWRTCCRDTRGRAGRFARRRRRPVSACRRAEVRRALERLAARGRVIEGDFLPGGRSREWCDASVLRAIKRRSLAKLRREIEPVEPPVSGGSCWTGRASRTRGRGASALLSAVERLDGAPVPASVLETEILPARVSGYRPGDLDALCAAGEVTWRGLEPLGAADGRIALFLAGRSSVASASSRTEPGALAAALRDLLARRGALFFADLRAETGAFPGDLLAAPVGAGVARGGHQRHARPVAFAPGAPGLAAAPHPPPRRGVRGLRAARAGGHSFATSRPATAAARRFGGPRCAKRSWPGTES